MKVFLNPILILQTAQLTFYRECSQRTCKRQSNVNMLASFNCLTEDHVID